MSALPLGDEISFGYLAFDHFVINNWDDSRLEATDGLQWNELALRYWGLIPSQRLPYHEASSLLSISGKPLPDQYKISRCLVPFQTCQERRICSTAERGRQVNVVRTCYSDSLQGAWEQLRSYCLSKTYELFPSGELLNDAQLYDVGERWPEVLLRMPSLVDTIQGTVEEDYEDALPWSDEHYDTYEEGSVDRASVECVNIIYVIDEEALREQLVKMKWLNWRGKSVWEWKIRPESMASMAGALANGLLLYDFVNSDDARWGDVISL